MSAVESTRQRLASVAVLQEGRRRAQAQRRREAIARVKAYQAWLARGSVLRDIPEIPSDHDFRAFREARR